MQLPARPPSRLWMARFALGAALVVAGTAFMLRSAFASDVFGLLIGFFGVSLGAPLTAPELAERVGGGLSRRLFLGEQGGPPRPAYSVPRARRVAGQFEEAIEALRALAAEFPAEVEAWREMLEIALLELDDPARAEALYREGLAALAADADKETLRRGYQRLQDRRAARLAAQPRR